MISDFNSLTTLQSLDANSVERLRELGITNLGDLLGYPPFRHARFLGAAKDNLLQREEVISYVDQSRRHESLAEILGSSTDALRDVGRKSAGILNRLGLRTIADLASFAAVDEAEEIITRAPSAEDDPFAPACVLPTCKKFSRNSKSYTSFFKEKEIRDLSVLSKADTRISNLFRFWPYEKKVIHLGYSVSYLQEWVYLGVHLGEPQGSVNLSMAQDTQTSMIDWRRAMKALRAEDTRVSERLASALFHQRAVDEVARATAEEHQYGATSTFGANAATAGSFVAAGAIVGGVGGGISGGLVGLSVDALTGGATLGLGTLSGAVVGSAVGSIAGAAAGSIVASGATTLGFVETDAEGDREIFGSSGQNIQQRTVQNSSSIRSFWSNIVSQSVQEEQQEIRTDRITNHNRIHALNALLFEVLNGYRVNIAAQDYAPILFLPFKPFQFDQDVLRTYWWLIRTLIVDKKLVNLLDEKYLSLTAAPNAIDQLEALPTIGEIKTAKVTVNVNLDGSAVEAAIENLAIAALGLAGGPLNAAVGVAFALFRTLFDGAKREKVKVRLLTANGSVNLTRDSSPNDDEDFVGRYSTTSAVEVAAITGVRIINDNGEFDLGGFDLSALAFDDLKASVSIKNKGNFTAALPSIGQLEGNRRISEEFKVGAKRELDVTWNIGDQLRAQFEGVDALSTELAAEKTEIQNAEQAESILLDFLNANKFTFTRLILQGTEPEQIMTVLEDVRIGDIELSEIAATTPIGFCGNHVVLPMKACKVGKAKFDVIGLDTAKLELTLDAYDSVDQSEPAKVVAYLVGLHHQLKEFLAGSAAGNGSVRETKLLEEVQRLFKLVEKLLRVVTGSPSGAKPVVPKVALASFDLFGFRISAAIAKVLAFLDAPVMSNSKDTTILCGYYEGVKATLAPRMSELLRTDEVSLPSPAVFMEPLLSNAKGAERYDMRRNSHYEILEAPSIAAGDPNVLRGRDGELTPTVPAATLSIQDPPDLPLPGSLAAALGEAGELNLGTLINTNASSLTSMLSNLSSMATELAKASAQLTGDAQQQALASATDVAKQVGDIVGKSLQTPAAPTPVPTSSPNTQQEKAEVKRAAEEIDRGDSTPQQKKELKRTIGAATTPDDRRDYQMSITFLDLDGIPYVPGSFDFTLTLSLFELGTVVDINGGSPIPLDPEGFFFPERFSLTKGRKIKLSLVADIGGVTVPGAVDLPLPDSPDIAFECLMKSETREFQENSVKEAVDTAVQTSGFGVNAGILLDSFLNAGAKFPFRIAEVTVDGGIKPVLDLKGAYNSSTTTTTGETSTTTTATTYKVTTPLNGWSIAVR